MKMSEQPPIVVILGCTGSGKTKLSIQLAQKFNGEIIGADAMQMYKGLNIITAKVTEEEKKLVPHHMIDILEPHEVATVVEYKNQAIKIIDDLLKANKLPIIVGGTNYYIEALLFNILIETKTTGLLDPTDYELPSEFLHKKLEILDPEMANKLHPNDKRKILRALEIIQNKGKKMSEIIEEQKNSKGGSSLGGGLRYDNVVILSLQCDQDVLDTRLNERVDKMLEQGLISELLNFHERYNQHRMSDDKTDYTRGIYQTIGFKEFHSFLKLSPEEQRTIKGMALFNKGVEALKLVTRQYARKQLRWNRNRFLASDRLAPPMYALDVTDVDEWDKNVLQPAIDIVENYIKHTPEKIKMQPLPKIEAKNEPRSQAQMHFCKDCQRRFVGNLQWTSHLKSLKHKKTVELRAKLNNFKYNKKNNKNEKQNEDLLRFLAMLNSRKQN